MSTSAGHMTRASHSSSAPVQEASYLSCSARHRLAEMMGRLLLSGEVNG
jgi:hypothetical protein